jgi:hypothetical protein
MTNSCLILLLRIIEREDFSLSSSTGEETSSKSLENSSRFKISSLNLAGLASGVSVILGFLIVPYAKVVMIQAIGRELFKIKILRKGDSDKPEKLNLGKDKKKGGSDRRYQATGNKFLTIHKDVTLDETISSVS